jgi:hypothetical protein
MVRPPLGRGWQHYPAVGLRLPNCAPHITADDYEPACTRKPPALGQRRPAVRSSLGSSRTSTVAHTSVLLLEGLGVGLQPVLTVAEAHIAAPKLRRVVPIRAHRDATSVSERATRWPDAGLGASCSRSHRG